MRKGVSGCAEACREAWNTLFLAPHSITFARAVCDRSWRFAVLDRSTSKTSSQDMRRRRRSSQCILHKAGIGVEGEEESLKTMIDRWVRAQRVGIAAYRLGLPRPVQRRSEEHTSELQSLR